MEGVYNDGTRSMVRRAGWGCERAAAYHDAACYCNGCLVDCIFECKLSQGVAGIIVQFRLLRMGFHGVENTLQEWVWVGSGLAMNDRWGCDGG